MSDVTRALILPDITRPSSLVLHNLALYWEEIVVPTYSSQLFGLDNETLVDAGVMRLLAREVSSAELFPHRNIASNDGGETVNTFLIHRDDDGKLTRVELVTMDRERHDETQETLPSSLPELSNFIWR